MSRSIERLVEEQVRRWLAEREIAERAPGRSGIEHPSNGRQHPVICVSRECGALGGHIGRLAAGRLGFAFYSQELVDEIAKQAQVSRAVVESVDERRRHGIAGWMDQRLSIGRFLASDYMQNLSELVLALGRRGSSVIVGRGAFVLLDPASTLRVRFRAPLAWRIEQMAERRGISHDEARSLVARIDDERVDFYRQNFRIDVGDPKHFDLVLDSSEASCDGAASAVVEAFDARFGAPPSQIRLKLLHTSEQAKADVPDA